MTRKEYHQAFRLTDREKAQIWQEIRDPYHRRTRPRRWLPALGGVAAVACVLAAMVLWQDSQMDRGPVPAPRVAAVHPSGELAAAPPAPSVEATAGGAVLRGQVLDAETREPLAFANVVLVDSMRTVMTDTLGNFTLDELSPGAHTIVVTYLGYAPQEKTLTVSPGDTAVATYALETTIVETMLAFDVDAARYMVEVRGAEISPQTGSEKFERYAIDSAEAARSREAGIIMRPGRPTPTSAAPPTTGAESGGTRNPNDRPYDLVYHQHHGVNPFVATEEDALSTFAVEVDDASWSIARRYLTDGHRPPPEAIRLEEIVNRLDAGLAHTGGDDFSLHADGMPSRFGPGYQLLRIGVRARNVEAVDRPAAHLTFVIDVSSSMNRENRLDLVKQALRILVDELQPADRVGIVTFGSEARTVLDMVAAEDRAVLLNAIDGLRTSGATNAEAGLRLAYDLAQSHARAGAINRLILCSDGVANIGPTSAESILAVVRDEADQGTSLTTVGFGMGNYNDTLMEQLANQGDGTYHYVHQLADAERVFRQNLTGTLQTVGREVKTQVEFDPAAVVRWRLLGYENRHLDDADFRNDAVDAGEIGAGHTAVALYEIKLSEKAARQLARGRHQDLGTVRLRWAKPRYHEAAGLVTERELRLTTRNLSTDWTGAPAHLRAAAVAAEFAEILRESYWARGTTLTDLLDPITTLVRDLPDDPDILELAQMIRQATKLPPK